MADRVLLIEDDPRLAEMISEYLGEAGFHVDRAANGSEGLTRQERESFDVLILDLMLPDGSGLELAREIRQSPASASIPILLVTARSKETYLRSYRFSSQDDYLPKPFSVRELLRRLQAQVKVQDSRPQQKELM